MLLALIVLCLRLSDLFEIDLHTTAFIHADPMRISLIKSPFAGRSDAPHFLHNRLSWIVLGLATLMFSSAVHLSAQPAVPLRTQKSDADISKVQANYVSSVLPAAPEQIARLHALSARYASSLLPDGKWPDIEYQNSNRANWKAAEHLERTLVMAKSSRLSREEGSPDPALDKKVIRALQAWTDHDYRNPNWWWNQIGVPELTGEIATLMQAQLPKAEVAKVEEIMTRSTWRKGRWTGANLIWGVENEVVRGCLQDDPDVVKEGYDRMYDEIKVISPREEGIQQDYSFHQHGAQLYNGGYGLTYANDVGRFISFAWGTHFQIPPDRMAIFSAYMLDGMQWMIRGNIIDYSVVGREITRANKVVAPQDWTAGPISPAGPAYSLENVVDLLAAEPTPRQQEFRNFAERLQGRKNAPSFIGNKQFWCSDFIAHRRRSYYTSVKMLSTRMQNAESTNGEGRKSEHLSDGANFLYLSGDEYKNIFPVWDWTKVPGTTAIQGTLDTGEKNAIRARGGSSFAGGVSDGTYGMAAMNLQRGHLIAKKAWFFFNDSYLCLGAGITLTGSSNAVATDVNQTLLKGSVSSNLSADPLSNGLHTYISQKPTWFFHNHVGYIFAPGTHVSLSIGAQTGRWSDIGSGSSERVTQNVFDLWIDHGVSPQDGSYEYVVLPDASPHETARRSRHPRIRILANNANIQAVWNRHLDIGMFAFHQPGSLVTPAGLIMVDHSCLIMLRRIAHQWEISASNPENQSLTLHVKIADRQITMTLPGGNLAGSSVTMPLKGHTLALVRYSKQR